jgi:hypothetical protein
MQLPSAFLRESMVLKCFKHLNCDSCPSHDIGRTEIKDLLAIKLHEQDQVTASLSCG